MVTIDAAGCQTNIAEKIIVSFRESYAAARAGHRSDSTDAGTTFRSASAAAQRAFRGADYAAQSSALVGMNSAAPSSYLGSMANLAAQRGNWWGDQHADQMATIGDGNAAESAFADAAHAASLQAPTG